MFKLLSLKNEIAVLGLALAYFIWLAAPDVTWINTDSDAGIYLWSTREWGLSHPTGAPLYNIVGNIINQGANLQEAAQRLSILSAVTAALTALVLYRETKSWVAPGVFMAAGVVVSQSTIVETYAPVTLTIALAWHWRNSPRLFPVAMALGMGIHHLIGFTVVPLMIWRYYRVGQGSGFPAVSRYDSIGFLVGVAWYAIYFPFAIKPEAAWAGRGIFDYFTSQSFLTGGIDPIEDGFQRIREAVFILAGGFGASFIVLFWKIRDKFLLWLMLAYILYYVTNLAPQTYVYVIPVFVFGGIALARMKLGRYQKVIVYTTIPILMVFNIFAYDIGRTLDESPTSARQFIDRVETLPDESTIISIGRGWERGLLWNKKSENTVRIITSYTQFDGWIGDPAITPTYRSVVVDPSRYLVRLIRCYTRLSCKYGRNRIDGVDSDSDIQSNSEILYPVLADNLLNTTGVYSPP